MIPPALSGALPETRAAWEALEASVAPYGVTVFMPDFGGVRTEADTTLILRYRDDDYQAALQAGTIKPDTTLQQFRPIAPYGRGFHPYGAAFDMEPLGWAPPMTYAKAVQLLGAMAPNFGLRWGGWFPTPDEKHFELAIPLAEAKAKWANWQASGGTDDSLSTTQYVIVQAQNPLVWALVIGVVVAVFSGRRRLLRV